jgi:hypothetical protein
LRSGRSARCKGNIVATFEADFAFEKPSSSICLIAACGLHLIAAIPCERDGISCVDRPSCAAHPRLSIMASAISRSAGASGLAHPAQNR